MLKNQLKWINKTVNKNSIQTKTHNLVLKYFAKKLPKSVFKRCCHFDVLEDACKQWAFDHLSISLKDDFFKEEVIYIDKNVDFKELVNVSENISDFRVEGFDSNYAELQTITLIVFNEFNQNKSISICVKIKENILLNTSSLANKEIVQL